MLALLSVDANNCNIEGCEFGVTSPSPFNAHHLTPIIITCIGLDMGYWICDGAGRGK